VVKVSGYNNAGTVEFLLDKNKNFYFLEVNARLQVEHPVTELVTGVDLVQQQIRIASGERLPFKQEDLSQRGHSIECRIYAEDPLNNFLPSAGKVLFLKEPKGPGVRHDCGIFSGSTVPIYYDPILAKLIVWAENRETARQRMVNALEDYVVLGIKTTIDFLKDVITHPQFKAGHTTTGFIEKHLGAWESQAKTEEGIKLALIASAFDNFNKTHPAPGANRGDAQKETFSPWQSLGKWRLGGRK
jgi:acetyl-CoA carboxylase biotin carboxylase subunit